MLEVLEAHQRAVPCVLVNIATKGFDAAEARDFINHLEARLAAANPSAIQLLRQHTDVGSGLLRSALLGVLPQASTGPSSRLSWNPHASDNETIANLKDIVHAMATATGRDHRLVWKEKPEGGLLLSDLFSKGRQRKPVAVIAFHSQEAISEARVLQSALSRRCHQRVTLHERSLPSSAADADALVLLLTRSTLYSADCLTAAAQALFSARPIVPVLLTGRGYEFASNQRLLQDLRAGLPAEEVAALERQLEGALTGSALGAGFDLVQVNLAEAIPNIIAVQWYPEGSDHQLMAVVDDIARRLPERAVRLSWFCGSTSGAIDASHAHRVRTQSTRNWISHLPEQEPSTVSEPSSSRAVQHV